MSPHYHAVVWIDHHQARVIHFNLSEAEEQTLHAPHTRHHLHAKAGSPSGTHLHGEGSYYREVAEALASAQEVLITGPSSAKHELVEYLKKHKPQLMAHVEAVETADKVTDAELLAAARRHFKAADRMKPQLG
jgi:stalled ribosome rescue protein Dom34